MLKSQIRMLKIYSTSIKQPRYLLFLIVNLLMRHKKIINNLEVMFIKIVKKYLMYPLIWLNSTHFLIIKKVLHWNYFSIKKEGKILYLLYHLLKDNLNLIIHLIHLLLIKEFLLKIEVKLLLIFNKIKLHLKYLNTQIKEIAQLHLMQEFLLLI